MLSEPKYQNFSLDKVLKKYPVIHMSHFTSDKLNKFLFTNYKGSMKNGELTSSEKLMLLPPLFPAYVIEIEQHDGDTDHILVYYETPEKVYLLYFLNGKKHISVGLDLSTYSTENFKDFTADITAISKSARELSNENLKLSATIIHILFTAVSVYMLYYSPDTEYVEPSIVKIKNRSHKKVGMKDRDVSEIILSSKRKRYRIAPDLPQRSPSRYKTPSWRVRGHYQRVGKDKKWKYISSTIAHRKSLREAEEQTPRVYKIKE